MWFNCLLLAFIFSWSPSSFAAQYIEIPLDASAEKMRKSIWERQDDVKEVFSFNLPDNSQYSFHSYFGNGMQKGIVDQTIRFLPSKEAVRTVEVELLAKHNPDANWVLPIFWSGPLSSLNIHYVFKFVRHPSKSEIENDLSSELSGLSSATIQILKQSDDEIKFTLSRELNKYSSDTTLDKNFVSAKIYSIFQPINDLALSRRKMVEDFIAKARNYTEIQNLAKLLVTNIDVKIKAYRDLFLPVAKLYGVKLDDALDTKPTVMPPEPGGSDEDFVQDLYVHYYKRKLDIQNSSSDDYVLTSLCRKAVALGRDTVREQIANSPGAITIQLFEDYLGKLPSDKELNFWFYEQKLHAFDHIDTQIADLPSSPQGIKHIQSLIDVPASSTLPKVDHSSAKWMTDESLVEYLFHKHHKKIPDSATKKLWVKEMEKFSQFYLESEISKL